MFITKTMNESADIELEQFDLVILFVNLMKTC